LLKKTEARVVIDDIKLNDYMNAFDGLIDILIQKSNDNIYTKYQLDCLSAHLNDSQLASDLHLESLDQHVTKLNVKLLAYEQTFAQQEDMISKLHQDNNTLKKDFDLECKRAKNLNDEKTNENVNLEGLLKEAENQNMNLISINTEKSIKIVALNEQINMLNVELFNEKSFHEKEVFSLNEVIKVHIFDGELLMNEMAKITEKIGIKVKPEIVVVEDIHLKPNLVKPRKHSSADNSALIIIKIDDLNTTLMNAQIENATIGELLEKQTGNAKNLKSENDNLSTELVKNQEKLFKTQQEFKICEDAQATLSSLYELLKKNKTDLENKIENVGGKCIEYEIQINTLQQEKNGLLERITTLIATHNEDLEQAHVNNDGTQSLLKNLRDSSEHKIKLLEIKMNEYSKLIDDSGHEKTILTDKLRYQKDIFVSIQKDKDELSAKNVELYDKILESKKIITNNKSVENDLNQNIEELKLRLSEVSLQSQERKQQIGELQMLLDVEILRNERELEIKKLNSTQDTTSRVKAMMKNMDETSNLNQQLLQTEIDELNRKIENITSESHSLEHKFYEESRNVSELNKGKQLLLSNIKEKDNELTLLKENLHFSKITEQESQLSVQLLNEQIIVLNTEMVRKEHNFNDLKYSIDLLNSEIEKLNSQITFLVEEHESDLRQIKTFTENEIRIIEEAERENESIRDVYQTKFQQEKEIYNSLENEMVVLKNTLNLQMSQTDEIILGNKILYNDIKTLNTEKEINATRIKDYKELLVDRNKEVDRLKHEILLVEGKLEETKKIIEKERACESINLQNYDAKLLELKATIKTLEDSKLIDFKTHEEKVLDLKATIQTLEDSKVIDSKVYEETILDFKMRLEESIEKFKASEMKITDVQLQLKELQEIYSAQIIEMKFFQKRNLNNYKEKLKDQHVEIEKLNHNISLLEGQYTTQSDQLQSKIHECGKLLEDKTEYVKRNQELERILKVNEKKTECNLETIYDLGVTINMQDARDELYQVSHERITRKLAAYQISLNILAEQVGIEAYNNNNDLLIVDVSQSMDPCAVGYAELLEKTFCGGDFLKRVCLGCGTKSIALKYAENSLEENGIKYKKSLEELQNESKKRESQCLKIVESRDDIIKRLKNSEAKSQLIEKKLTSTEGHFLNLYEDTKKCNLKLILGNTKLTEVSNENDQIKESLTKIVGKYEEESSFSEKKLITAEEQINNYKSKYNEVSKENFILRNGLNETVGKLEGSLNENAFYEKRIVSAEQLSNSYKSDFEAKEQEVEEISAKLKKCSQELSESIKYQQKQKEQIIETNDLAEKEINTVRDKLKDFLTNATYNFNRYTIETKNREEELNERISTLSIETKSREQKLNEMISTLSKEVILHQRTKLVLQEDIKKIGSQLMTTKAELQQLRSTKLSPVSTIQVKTQFGIPRMIKIPEVYNIEEQSQVITSPRMIKIPDVCSIGKERPVRRKEKCRFDEFMQLIKNGHD
jgi:chromosome segregation ATPase